MAVYDDNDTLIKAFYTEAGECNANHVHTWLQDYFATNGKKGFMTITKVLGTNNVRIEEGHKESGYTKAFIECAPLELNSNDRWFKTSNVIEIDWENKRFTTINSIYSFTFNETSSN